MAVLWWRALYTTQNKHTIKGSSRFFDLPSLLISLHSLPAFLMYFYLSTNVFTVCDLNVIIIHYPSSLIRVVINDDWCP